MDLQLKGRVALVTGGARGIGRGIALTLAAEGATVAVNYRERADAAEEVVRRIRADGGEAEAFPANVGEHDEVELMVQAVLGALRPDRHPGQQRRRGDAASDSGRAAGRVGPGGRTNLYGCFHCSRLVGRHMVERGGGGKIVSISSIHGRVAKAGMGPYCATKAAIDMFSKQLAVELAPHRINVNVVASGTIITEINLPLYQSTKPEDIEKRTAVLHRVPWGEIGQPEDIGKAVAFLASDAARYITGAVLYVDGGYTADGTPRLPSGARVP